MNPPTAPDFLTEAFRTMKNLLLIILLLHCPFALKGQYFLFNQPRFSPERLNPAAVAQGNDWVFRVGQRRLGTEAGGLVRSSHASAVYPFLKANGQRWGAMYASAFDDRTGLDGLFQTTEMTGGFAQTLPLTSSQRLSMGAKVSWVRRNLSLAGLTTGSQYVTGQGFDPAVFNGEFRQGLQAQFVSLSMGVHWEKTDRQQQTKSYLGLALYDVNQPNESLVNGKSLVPFTVMASGGYRLDTRGAGWFMPEIYAAYMSNTVRLVPGVIAAYPMANGQRVEMHLRHAVSQSLMGAFQWHTPTFSVGISYETPMGNQARVFNSAVEIGLEWRKPRVAKGRQKKEVVEREKPDKQRDKKIKKKKKKGKKAPAKKSKKKKKGRFTYRQPRPSTTTPKPKPKPTVPDTLSVVEATPSSDSLSVRVGRPVADALPDTLRLQSSYFGFNSSDLTAEAEEALLPILDALAAHPNFHLRIVGHTDNVGAAATNLRISQDRADAVARFLMSQGVAPERIEAIGEGETKPLNTNRTPEERAANRRVELLIVRE